MELWPLIGGREALGWVCEGRRRVELVPSSSVSRATVQCVKSAEQQGDSHLSFTTALAGINVSSPPAQSRSPST